MAKQCPNCGGDLTNVGGDIDKVACDMCGLVDPDPNQYLKKEDKKPETTTEASNEDDIKNGWKDQVSVGDSSDEKIIEILDLVEEYVECMSLPKPVRIRAAEVVLSAWEVDLFAGRQKETVTAGGVYVAAREHNKPRPMTKLSDRAGIDESSVNRSYRLLISELGLNLSVPTAADYTEYLGHELSLPTEVIRDTEETLTHDIGCSGNPAGIAAAVLYLIANNRGYEITLTEAGDAAGVCKETVWRNTRSIRQSGAKVR